MLRGCPLDLKTKVTKVGVFIKLQGASDWLNLKRQNIRCLESKMQWAQLVMLVPLFIPQGKDIHHSLRMQFLNLSDVNTYIAILLSLTSRFAPVWPLYRVYVSVQSVQSYNLQTLWFRAPTHLQSCQNGWNSSPCLCNTSHATYAATCATGHWCKAQPSISAFQIRAQLFFHGKRQNERLADLGFAPFAVPSV